MRDRLLRVWAAGGARTVHAVLRERIFGGGRAVRTRRPTMSANERAMARGRTPGRPLARDATVPLELRRRDMRGPGVRGLGKRRARGRSGRRRVSALRAPSGRAPAPRRTACAGRALTLAALSVARDARSRAATLWAVRRAPRDRRAGWGVSGGEQPATAGAGRADARRAAGLRGPTPRLGCPAAARSLTVGAPRARLPSPLRAFNKRRARQGATRVRMRARLRVRGAAERAHQR